MKYIFFILLLLLLSCKRKEITIPIISYNVGFNANSKCSGAFYNFKTKQDIVYFGDTKTNKKIKFFIKDGTLIKEISIATIVNELKEIDNIFITTLDSINLFSLRSNKILTINDRLEKISEINLQKLIYKNGDVYQYGISPISSNIIFKNNILLASIWQENLNIKLDSTKNKYVNYSENLFNSTNLIQVSLNKRSNLQSKPILNSFYKNISKVPQIFAEDFQYAIINKKLIVISFYSSTIYIFNQLSGQLLKKVDILSNYSSILNGGIDIKEAAGNNLQNIVNKEINKSMIRNIFFDSKKEIYEVVFQHQINQNEDRNNRKFSVILYDKNFKKYKEVLFDDYKYNSYTPIFVDNKILLEIKSQPLNIKKYGIFDF